MNIVCIPVGWVAKTKALSQIIEWAQPRKIKFFISNRVDLNESQCIAYATNNHANLYIVESDVVPQQPFEEINKIIKEDLKKYKAHVFVGILRSELGILVNPFYKDRDVWEVEWASMGFVYIPFKTLKKLQPIAWYTYPDGRSLPMFMTYTAEKSQDTVFFEILKKKKMKVITDKRVKLLHYREMPI